MARGSMRATETPVFVETESLQIADHVVQVAHGGTSNDDNLRTLCSQCNNKRSKRAKPEANPADSLIPDSLIPDSLIPEESMRFTPVPGDSLRSTPDDRRSESRVDLRLALQKRSSICTTGTCLTTRSALC